MMTSSYKTAFYALLVLLFVSASVSAIPLTDSQLGGPAGDMERRGIISTIAGLFNNPNTPKPL